MVSIRPSLASYARVAYARELTGDRSGALVAMRLALDTAAGQPEPSAWVHVELAKLELGLGRADAARRHARAALQALPGYPSARLELARIEAASGRLDRALVAGTTCCRGDPDIAGDRSLCRAARPAGPLSGSRPSAVDRRCHRSPAASQRRAGRSRVGGLSRRQPHSAARDGRARPACARETDRRSTATTRLPGRLPVRDAVTRHCPTRNVRYVSGHRMRSSSSIAATRKAARAIEPRCGTGTGRHSI